MAATTEERIGVNEAEIENLQKSDIKQWAAIEKLQNRLPLWATIVLMVMSGAVGSALTYAAVVARLATAT